MYGIFTYIWVIIRANVGKYPIHGAYGFRSGKHMVRLKFPKCSSGVLVKNPNVTEQLSLIPPFKRERSQYTPSMGLLGAKLEMQHKNWMVHDYDSIQRVVAHGKHFQLMFTKRKQNNTH